MTSTTGLRSGQVTRLVPFLAVLSLMLGLVFSPSVVARGTSALAGSGADVHARDKDLIAKGKPLPDYDIRSGIQAKLSTSQAQSATALRARLGSGTTVRFGAASGGISQLFNQGGYLTGPRSGAASVILDRYLVADRALLRLSRAELATFKRTTQDLDKRTGVSHLYFNQRIDGRQVFGSVLKGHVDGRGRIISIEANYYPGTTLPRVGKTISATQALTAALRSSMPDVLKKARASGSGATASSGSLRTIGAAYKWPSVTRAASGADQLTTFAKGPFAAPVQVREVIFPTADGSILAWQVTASAPSRGAAYALVVDASSGKLLYRTNLIRDAAPDASIFPKNPDATPLATVAYEGDPALSPQGWHLDVPGGGVATLGNNLQGDVATEATDLIYPFTDDWKTTGLNSFDLAGLRVRYAPVDALATEYTAATSPAGSTAPASYDLLPFFTNTDDGTVGLFCDPGWTANVLGATFTDFWVNTNGSVSLGAGIPDSFPSKVSFSNDARRIAGLWRDLNPGAGGTLTGECAPEGGGQSIRLVWDAVPNFPADGSHTFAITIHGIGTGLDNIIDVDYGAVSSPTDELVGVGGNPGTPFDITTTGVVSYRDISAGVSPGIAGGIAQTFPDPDLNLSITNFSYHLNRMHDFFYDLGFTESAGNYQVSNFGNGGAPLDPLQAEAQYGMGVFNNAFFATAPDGTSSFTASGLWSTGGDTCRRDSSFDASIIDHEFTHGVTTQMVGGGSNVFVLGSFQGAALGEGWSDATPITIFDDPVIGAYVVCDPAGIRSSPYDTHPGTYADFGNKQGPFPAGIGDVFKPEFHRDGEVWAATAWDIDEALGATTTQRLLFEGLRYTPGDPTFLDARDAILIADLVVYAGVHTSTLFDIFAARGMGVSASASEGSFGTFRLQDGWRTTVFAAYDTPADRYAAAPQSVLFSEDFETPSPWTTAGDDGLGGAALWHSSSRQASSGTKAFYYGQEATGDYDTGFTNYGSLISPAIVLPALDSSQSYSLEWDQFRQTADPFFSLFDGGWVRIIDVGSAARSQVAFVQNTRTSFGNTNWEHQKVNLNAFAGKTIQIEFYMDTFDAIDNTAEGWYVDNVKVNLLGPPPELSIDDVTKTEGSPSGTRNYTFNVTLSGPSTGTVTVKYRTVNGSAQVASDYLGIATTTLTFTAGETSKPVTVVGKKDVTYEADETFFVQLKDATGATIADNTGQGTMLNDDPKPQFFINNQTRHESLGSVTFTITKAGPTDLFADVHYATANGTAHSGSDYVAKTGNFHFLPGQTSKTIVITLINGPADEPTETFFVNLTAPVNATIGDPQGVGTILDD